MSDPQYRVVQSKRSFDLEIFAGVYRETRAEVWSKVAYYRTKSEVLAALSRLRLSTALADKLPAYHPDAIRALSSVAERGGDLSDAQRGALAKANAAKRAKRARP